MPTPEFFLTTTAHHRTLLALLLCSGCASKRMSSTPTGESWRSITAGASHACAIRVSDDHAHCWGADHEGEVSNTPKVPFTTVSAGANLTCGIERDTASLRCWGSRDDQWSRSVVNRTPTGARWRAVYAAEFRACGIQEAGTLHCWGTGVGGLELDPEAARLGGGRFQAAWVSDRMLCGLGFDGKAICDVFSAPGETFVELGEACGLTSAGTVHCWGADADVQATPSVPLRHLGTGNDFTHCGLRASDGRAVCWGHPEGWLEPVPKQPLLELAVGWGFACGIGSSGESLVCWGERLSKVPELASPY